MGAVMRHLYCEELAFVHTDDISEGKYLPHWFRLVTFAVG